MLLLSFVVLLPLYAALTSWAYRTGGARRLWVAGLASVVVVSLAASVVGAAATVQRSPAAPLYMAALFGIPILGATVGASLTRAHVAAALVGGVVGVVVVLAVSMYVLAQVHG